MTARSICRNFVMPTFSSPRGDRNISAIRLSVSNSGQRPHRLLYSRHAIKPANRTLPFLDFFDSMSCIFITADERDVIRLRTNYRDHEQVFLYRTTVSADRAKEIFLIYADYLDKLRTHPEWYNALTRNCTTTLDTQIAADVKNPQPWNYQLLLNGTLDELLYDRGRLVTGGLPFLELKEREHINAAGKAADDSPNWSALIRVGRVGF